MSKKVKVFLIQLVIALGIMAAGYILGGIQREAHASVLTPGAPLYMTNVIAGKRNRAVEAYIAKVCHLLSDKDERVYCEILKTKNIESCKQFNAPLLRSNCEEDVRIVRGGT